MANMLELVGATKHGEDVFSAYDCEIAVNWEKKTVRELNDQSEWLEFLEIEQVIWAGEFLWQKSDRKVYELVSYKDDEWLLVNNGHVHATIYGTEPLMLALKAGELKRVQRKIDD